MAADDDIDPDAAGLLMMIWNYPDLLPPTAEVCHVPNDAIERQKTIKPPCLKCGAESVMSLVVAMRTKRSQGWLDLCEWDGHLIARAFTAISEGGALSDDL